MDLPRTSPAGASTRPRAELPRIRRPVLPPLTLGPILGRSPSVAALRHDIERVAGSSASTVLILGETGVGKELVAHAIHDGSARTAHSFVAVNCSAVPSNLLEEEFFGYEAGAFTDARHRKRGLLEVADQGTLFLDEIGELEPALQAKLLRILEGGSFRKLGGTEDVAIDVRFVAATNGDLAQLVDAGRFRADLFYRLQVVALHIPPLRERKVDIPELARHFLAHFAARFHRTFTDFTREALDKLEAHSWPGNIRELRNAIERAVLLEEGPIVEANHLLVDVRAAGPGKAGRTAAPLEEDLDLGGIELRTLVRALERSHGNASHAARLLGVSRDTVRSWMKRFDVRIETRVIVGSPEK